MNTYRIIMKIRAECPDDVRELIEEYTGQETDIEIKSIRRVRG